ncbi:MAG: hypothetical protein AABZ12_08620 [Planctomycetota bacterium]
MSTAASEQLKETIQSLKDTARSALANESVDDFSAFERYLNEVEAYAREVQQAMWADEARATVRRLEKGEPLTPTDHDVIRAFLISDAQAYLAQENSFNDWIHELNRIVGVLDRQASAIDRNSVVQLRGVLKDAIRLVPDIRNYLTEKRRVEQFEGALSTLDKSSRELLHRVLTEQLRTPNR